MPVIIQMSLISGTRPYTKQNVRRLLDELCNESDTAGLLSLAMLAKHFLRENPDKELAAELAICEECIFTRSDQWIGCRPTQVASCPKGKDIRQGRTH